MANCEHGKIYYMDFANQPKAFEHCPMCQRDSALLKLDAAIDQLAERDADLSLARHDYATLLERWREEQRHVLHWRTRTESAESRLDRAENRLDLIDHMRIHQPETFWHADLTAILAGERDVNPSTTTPVADHSGEDLSGKADELLCSDCPPAEYPNAKTRCAPCPRRSVVESGQHSRPLSESEQDSMHRALRKSSRVVEILSTDQEAK